MFDGLLRESLWLLQLMMMVALPIELLTLRAAMSRRQIKILF